MNKQKLDEIQSRVEAQFRVAGNGFVYKVQRLNNGVWEDCAGIPHQRFLPDAKYLFTTVVKFTVNNELAKQGCFEPVENKREETIEIKKKEHVLDMIYTQEFNTGVLVGVTIGLLLAGILSCGV